MKWTKEQRRIYFKNWRDKNKTKLSIKAKLWRENNKEHNLERKRLYCQNNKEKTSAYHKIYRKEHKELYKISGNKRSLIKKKMKGSHTKEEFETLKKFYNYMCLCCKKFEPEIKLCEDHVFPVGDKRCTDFIDNIQPLCVSCNSIKNIKVIDFRILQKSCPVKS